MDKRVWMSMFLLSVSFNVAAIGVVAFGLRARAQAQASEAGSEVRPRLELRLDVAQQDMFDRVRKTFDDERGRQETRINSVRDGLVRELVTDQPDSRRIDSLLEQMALGQSQLQRSLVDRILQEGAILRPDQRAVFARLLERRLLRVSTPRSGDTRGSSTMNPQETK